jgi:adenosylcobinamide kinase / adenosylcobinamide-phosphate guanylyltransferase
MGQKLTLVLGGARSGKSDYAQRMVEGSGEAALFVATATAGDEEMKARIAAHKASRSDIWQTLEAPLQVGQAIEEAATTPWVLLDCVTLLASNVLFSLQEPVDERIYQQAMNEEVQAILRAYQAQTGQWVIVSNEVGLGLVPPSAISRYYRDALGRANQMLAAAADEVVLMVAGIPMKVKG